MCEMSKSLILEELLPSAVIFYFKQIDHDFLNLFIWYAMCSIFSEFKCVESPEWWVLTGVNLDTDLFS
jgi:hypothetical protein